MGQRLRGFTLIELMIAVAIVAILASIAVPSYQEHLRKGRRAAAQAYLLDLANRQEQYLIDNRSYASAASDLATAPSDVSQYYTVNIAATAGPPPTFVIRATPIAGSVQAADVTLTINQLGTKTPSDKW